MENGQAQARVDTRVVVSEENEADRGAFRMGEACEALRQREARGEDAPFATLTWQNWRDLQTQVVQCFSRFVRAVEEGQPAHTIMIGLEMQEIVTSLLLEAYAQCSDVPLAALPPERVKQTH